MTSYLDYRLWLIGAAVLSTLGCSPPPPTYVTPLSMTILTEETSKGSPLYRAVIEESERRLSRDATVVDPVVRVAARIVAAARHSAHGPIAGHFSWEIAVIENDWVHRVFVLPGGSIVVYSGIFRIAETEAGLAAVLGHEVAHALARHSSSEEDEPPALFTRDQEMEADAMGLKLMADAGYDPWEMLALWQRMKKMAGSESVEDPLLSHITYDRRMYLIAAQLPEALPLYERTRRAPQRMLPVK